MQKLQSEQYPTDLYYTTQEMKVMAEKFEIFLRQHNIKFTRLDHDKMKAFPPPSSKEQLILNCQAFGPIVNNHPIPYLMDSGKRWMINVLYPSRPVSKEFFEAHKGKGDRLVSFE